MPLDVPEMSSLLADAVDAGLDNGELIQKDWTAPPTGSGLG